MAFIESQKLARPDPLRRDNHGEIGQTQIQIRVPMIQLDRGFIFARIQSWRLKAPGPEVFSECTLCPRAEALT